MQSKIVHLMVVRYETEKKNEGKRERKDPEIGYIPFKGMPLSDLLPPSMHYLLTADSATSLSVG